MKSCLFVCLGNICRSPAAEGVLRAMAEKEGVEIEVASCGLGDWHVGQLPDKRMRDAARRRGYVLASRAQGIQERFFDEYETILAADHAVMIELLKIAKTPAEKAKVQLMTKFSQTYPGQEVPDPYYGGTDEFEYVMDMVEDICEGILFASTRKL